MRPVPPDNRRRIPSDGEFEKIRDLRRNQQYAEAHAAAEAFLISFPDSSHHDEAETMLGELNVLDLLSNQPGPDKVEYTVQRGDVIDRVAHKTKCNEELLYQANGLERTMLRIGQKVACSAGRFCRRGAPQSSAKSSCSTTAVFSAGTPSKYPAGPTGQKIPDIHTKVQEKVATKDGRRVAFGTKDYPAACVPSRWSASRDTRSTARRKPPTNPRATAASA